MQASDISFVQTQITRIGTALFFCDHDSRLNFPAYIITALKTDDAGEIWFFISRAGENPAMQHAPFGAHLEFYRKGYPFFMRIGGLATVENAAGCIQDLMGKSFRVPEEVLDDVLLVKVKMASVDFKELNPEKEPLLLQVSQWWKQLRAWLGHWRQHPTPAV